VGTITRNYPNLFEQDTDEADQGTNTISAERKFIDRWGWFSLLDELSNGDYCKWDTILYDWTITKFFNTMAYIKDRNRVKRLIEEANKPKRV
jgi:hypothetical protein